MQEIVLEPGVGNRESCRTKILHVRLVRSLFLLPVRVVLTHTLVQNRNVRYPFDGC